MKKDHLAKKVSGGLYIKQLAHNKKGVKYNGNFFKNLRKKKGCSLSLFCFAS